MAGNYYAHSMFPYNSGDHHNQQTNQHHGNFMNGSSNDMTYQNYGETNSDHNSQKYFNDQMFNYNNNNSNNNSFFSSSNQGNQGNEQFWNNKRGHNYNSNLNTKDDQSGFYRNEQQSINKLSSGLNQMSIDKTKFSSIDKSSSLANKNAKQQQNTAPQAAKTMSWASIASQPAKAQPKSFKSKLATVVLSTSTTTKHVPPPMPPVAQISLDEIEPIPNPWSKPANNQKPFKDEPNNEPVGNNPSLNTSRNSDYLRKQLDGTGNRDYNAQHNQPNHRSYASRDGDRFNENQNRVAPPPQQYNRFENNNNQNNRFDNRNDNRNDNRIDNRIDNRNDNRNDNRIDNRNDNRNDRFNNQNNRNGLNNSHNSYGSRNENLRDNNYHQSQRDNNQQQPPPMQPPSNQNYSNYNQRNYNNQNNNYNQNNYYNNKYPNQRPNQYQHSQSNNQYNQNRNQPNNRFGPGGHMHQQQQNKNQLPPPQFVNKQSPQQQPPPPLSNQLTEQQIQQENEAKALLEKLTLENNYNPSTFDLNPKNAKYFIIKSYSEDDIHRSIKYSIWCSTEHGNIKLDNAFRDQGNIGPIYLFYSVNGSGHFCGIAQMVSPVDYNSSSSVWCQDKWKGQFRVKWIYVKDVPNSELRHIVLENNEFKPVTNSRDTQEVPPEKGRAVLKIIHSHKHKTSIFDDFFHYERKQNEELGGRRMMNDDSASSQPTTFQKNNNNNHHRTEKREQSPSDSHNLNNSNNSKASLLSSNYEPSNIKKSWAEQCD